MNKIQNSKRHDTKEIPNPIFLGFWILYFEIYLRFDV